MMDAEHYILKLEKKLSRYESKLTTLVEAYKNLKHEKETLESTLKTMATNCKPSTISKAEHVGSGGRSSVLDPLGGLVVTSSSSDMLSSAQGNSLEKVAAEEDALLLLGKVDSLSAALVSLTESKSKMEISYLADRKKLLSDHRQEIAALTKEKYEALELLEEVKSKLAQEQHQRSSDEKDHGSMLTELQGLLSAERIQKEELKAQLQEKLNLLENISGKAAIQECSIKGLSEAVVLSSSSTHEGTSRSPSPSVEALPIDNLSVKMDHQDALMKEQQRANQAESLLKSYRTLEEERIADLEMKIGELSASVGRYDRLRMEDQAIIQKLRQKLSDSEGDRLSVSSQGDSVTDGNLEMQDLQELVSKLKALLRLSLKRNDKKQPDLIESSPFLMNDLDDILLNDSSHHICQMQYRQLFEEYEAYKLKYLGATLKRVSSKEEAAVDASLYHEKCQQLEGELKHVRDHYQEKEKEFLDQIRKLETCWRSCELQCNRRLSDAEVENRKQIALLEVEIQKQRVRTVDLLLEKDKEIDRLKERLNDVRFPSSLAGLQNASGAVTDPGLPKATTARPDEVSVVEEITRSSMQSASEGSGLFHFAQVISQHESDLFSCRAEIIELTAALHDAERRESQVLEQMNALKDLIRKLERDRSRETENMEYLKNICMQYWLTDSHSVQQQLVTSIAAILHFSPQELQSVRRKQASWWSRK